MIQSLNKKWKEVLFAFSGFGPNFLMILMGAYFSDAMNPAALGTGSSYQAIASGVCFVLPALFPILYAIAKAFDGLIDIPFAHVTDTLKTRWGRRRPPIIVCLIPMIISFAMCWSPVFGSQIGNTIWIFVWALIFFSTYTMCMIAFYGSLSTTCSNEQQRARVSSYKSFFDTITYCVVYALVPLLLDLFKVHIDKFVFFALPLMLTMLIPLFMIKEGAKYGYPENLGKAPQKVTLKESLKLTFKNRPFMSWIVVNACAFFGLQMFLTGMNAMIIGGMGFNGAEMALINTCAFAPVPIMLYLFGKLKAKKGFRFTYQTCLAAFGISILSFFFASLFMTGGNKMIQYIIACIGGVAGSWGIGAFFMGSYLVPAQVSSVEEKLTGKNHSAMYFAAQAVSTSIIGALSSLIYENIKMLFISKAAGGVVWAENAIKAAEKFSELSGSVVEVGTVYNLGTLIVPFVVFAMCFLGLFLCFRMPKEFTPAFVEKELSSTRVYKEPVWIHTIVSILTATLGAYAWSFILMGLHRKLKIAAKYSPMHWLFCCVIPFYAVFYLSIVDKQMACAAEQCGVKRTNKYWLFCILGLLFPILPLNIITLAIIQRDTNKLVERSENYQDDAGAISEEMAKIRKQQSKSEIIFVQVSLWVLSGSLFGFIWDILMIKSLKALRMKRTIPHGIFAMLVPFYSIFFLLKAHKHMKEVAKERGVTIANNIIPTLILSAVFPILPFNVVGLALVQHNLNLLHEAEKDEQVCPVGC